MFGYCGIGNYRMLLWYTCKNCVYKRGSRPVSRHRHLTIVLQWETGRALWRIGLQLPLVYSHFLSCIKSFWLQGVPLFAVYVDCWLLCGVLSGWNVAHEKVASLIDVQVVKLQLAAARLGLAGLLWNLMVSCEAVIYWGTLAALYLLGLRLDFVKTSLNILDSWCIEYSCRMSICRPCSSQSALLWHLNETKWINFAAEQQFWVK